MADVLMQLLPSMSFPFDTVAMQPEGLLLSKCSCAGTARYFIPRAHVDFVTTGRQLWIKTMLAGVALMAVGAFFMKETADKRMGEILLYVGIGLAAFAFMAMLPTSLSVGSNNATFTSTKCCNDAEAIINWLRSPPPQYVAAAAMRTAAVVPVVTPMAQVQQQKQQQQQQQQQQYEKQQQQQMAHAPASMQYHVQSQPFDAQIPVPAPVQMAVLPSPTYSQAQSQYSTLQHSLSPPLSSRRAARPITPHLDSPSQAARPQLLQLSLPAEPDIPAAVPASAPDAASAGVDYEQIAINVVDVDVAALSPNQTE